MIESPIVWDGSGLLPGESLSKHRGRKDESTSEATAELHHAPADEPAAGNFAPDAVEEQDFIEEISEPDVTGVI